MLLLSDLTYNFGLADDKIGEKDIEGQILKWELASR